MKMKLVRWAEKEPAQKVNEIEVLKSVPMKAKSKLSQEKNQTFCVPSQFLNSWKFLGMHFYSCHIQNAVHTCTQLAHTHTHTHTARSNAV